MKHSAHVHIFVFGYSMMQRLKMYDIDRDKKLFRYAGNGCSVRDYTWRRRGGNTKPKELFRLLLYVGISIYLSRAEVLELL